MGQLNEKILKLRLFGRSGTFLPNKGGNIQWTKMVQKWSMILNFYMWDKNCHQNFVKFESGSAKLDNRSTYIAGKQKKFMFQLML